MSDQQIRSTQDDAPMRHNATDRLNVPLMAFAGELIRLAEVVKRNLETGVAPIQTLSQLNAMEPIIGVLRVAGFNSVGGTIGLGMRFVGSVEISPSACSHWKKVRRCRQAVNTVAGVQRVVISARYASTFR